MASRQTGFGLLSAQHRVCSDENCCQQSSPTAAPLSLFARLPKSTISTPPTNTTSMKTTEVSQHDSFFNTTTYKVGVVAGVGAQEPTIGVQNVMESPPHTPTTPTKTPLVEWQRPQSPPQSRSPKWANEFRLLDCIHCKYQPVAADNDDLMIKLRDLERQSIHDQIKIEMQRLLTTGGVPMDFGNESDDDFDDLPNLSIAVSDCQTVDIAFPKPSPPQCRQATASTNPPIIAKTPSSHRGLNPIPLTTAPPEASGPIAIHPGHMSINMWPDSGVGVLGGDEH